MPVLVVDDDWEIRSLVAEVLDDEGYRVLTAADGREALAVLDREPVALMLIDMRMPVLDGWGVAAALRERPNPPPVLVMTAATDARAWAEQIGAEGYVGKPFDLRDLLHAVARLRVPKG